MEQTQSKYYYPTVEELHIGYECEASFTSYAGYFIFDKDPDKQVTLIEPEDKEAAKNWVNFRVIEEEGLWTANNTRDMKTACMLLKDKRLRTKYLDKADIESLGWVDKTEKFVDSEWTKKFPVRRKFEYIIELDNRWLILYPNNIIAIVAIDVCKEMDKGTIHYDSVSSREYQGECKSINELKKLMQWLKIQ